MDNVQLEIVGQDVPTTDKAGVKQLVNLDFEQGWTPWLKGLDFDDPENTTDPTDIGVGPEMAHSGNLGAYIRHSTGTTDTFHYPVIYGQYYRDKQVRLSAYMNLDKATGSAELGFDALYLDENGNSGPQKYDIVQALPSPPGWQRVEATLDIPDKTWGILISVNFYGEGEVWIDDVQLDVLGPASATPTP